MDRHLTEACKMIDPSGLLRSTKPTTSASKTSKPNCSRARCTAKTLVPVLCTACQRTYCLAHRLGPDHACPGSPQPQRPLQTQPRPKPSASPRTTSASSSSSPPTPAATASPSVLDRYRIQKHTKAEAASQRKALEWRAQKGSVSSEGGFF